MNHNAHHLLHLILLSAASLAFAVAVARQIRSNGFAGFSWRIADESPNSR